MKRWILSLLFLPSLVWAQKSLIERTYEGRSKEKNPVIARQDILTQATVQISEQLIKEIIGDAKYARNKTVISNKIIKNAVRYLPFSKPGDMEPIEPEGFKMTALLRVNVDELQAMLLENGLFYQSDSTPIVLPSIRIVDRVNSKNYFWWVDSDLSQKPFLLKEGRSLETNLKTALLKHNFYLLRPQALRFQQLLPQTFKTETLRTEDWQLVAQKFNAQVLLDGELSFNKSQERSEAFTIDLRLTATQVMNSRVIAEVSRKFETDPGPFEAVSDRKLKEVLESASAELSTQIFEAWQKGSLGASLYRLTVRGHFPMQQQESFKEALKNKVREVKSVRERLITSEGVVYEVDSALSPKELSQKASQIEVGTVKLVLESATDKEVSYRVSR
jgi:hypothetical protein